MIENWLRTNTEQRLTARPVENLYFVYNRFGILACTANIIESVSEQNRLPILHTLTSHVTKEKPVLTYGVLMSRADLDKEKTIFISSAVDLLWTFSLMYDDMFDHDQMRSSLPSAWVKFGSDETYQSASEGLERVKETATEVLSGTSGKTIDKLVGLGLSSLKLHKDMKPGVSVDELLENYRQRALFHTALPFALVGMEIYRGDEAFQVTENLNLAGQILNDLKDVSSNYVWVREGFSDIRTGVMTVPSAILLGRLPGNDRDRFLSVFGKDQLTGEDKGVIAKMFDGSNSVNVAANLSLNLYEMSRLQFRNVLNPEFASYADEWINYKIEQLSELRK